MNRPSWLLQGLKTLLRVFRGRGHEEKVAATETAPALPKPEEADELQRLADAVQQADLDAREERVLALRHGIKADPELELERKWDGYDEHPYHTRAHLALIEEMVRQQAERRGTPLRKPARQHAGAAPPSEVRTATQEDT
jgi:hypothetical protein